MKVKTFTSFFVLLLLSLWIKSAIGQVTYTVGASGQDFETVQEAINSLTVIDGDIIQVVDAVHTEFNIAVTKSLTITGINSETSTIQAAENRNSAEGRIFYVEAGITATIENLTITHGKSSVYGGGIYNGGTLTIDNCVITDNEVETGNAEESHLGGGGIYNAGMLSIYSTEISNNKSEWHGGGIWMAHNNTELYVENCVIKDNRANNGGGGFGAYRGESFEFKNTLIVNNTAASKKGGGIHLSNNISPKLTLNSVTISGNSAGDVGGGVHQSDGQLYIVNTIIAGNSASGSVEESDVAIYGTVYSEGYNIIGIDDWGNFEETALDYEGTLANPFDPELDENFAPYLTSPCINYGPSNTASLNLMSTDPYGNPRVFDGNVDIIDIGAVELQDEPLPTYLIQVKQTALDLGTIPLNQPTYGTIKIDNIGQAELSIDSVIANGGFKLAMNGEDNGDSVLYNKTVASHSTGGLHVYINSAVDSTFSGSLTIYSNATDNPEITVNLAAIAASGTDYFKGTIVSNTNWCQDTVHIGGDVTLAKNVTLTICEGTVIDFLGDYTFTVNGLLQANGNETDTIIFTTEATQWNGLRFENVETPAQAVSNLNYVRIEKAYADNGDEYSKGGGIYLDESAELTIENSEIINNRANHQGGGIYNAGLLTINSSLISQNSTINTSSNYGGGGVANKGELYIYNSAIYNNTTAYHGGGILNIGDNATLYLENDSITNNTASRAGGGIGNVYVKQVDIVNCVIANNTATSRKGGGIQNGGNSTGTINIKNSTIYGNTAHASYYGGGIQNEKGTFNILNSIIAGNTAGTYDDVYNTGTLNSLGYNIIGNEDGYSFPVTDGDLVGTASNPIDAMLNNDYSLSDSSVAINHGIADTTGLNLPATDLAGNPRIFDGTKDVIDIGAYELQQEPNENYILSIAENNLDFTLVSVDSVSYLEVELVNLGFGIVEIDSVIAPDGYEVSISGSQYNDTITNFLVQAYNSSVLTVKFAPTSAVTYAGNIVIKSNDDSEPEKNISVTGDGSGYLILSGEIASNTTICADTVKVTGDVTVPNGITLEICAGTVVEMQGNYTFNVQGRLLAEGTETDTIVFYHVSSGDWGGIRFDGTSNENDSSKICYSIIKHGAADYGGALYIDGFEKLVFRNNILSNNSASYSGGAIYNKGTLVIENCIFNDNSANSSASNQGGGAIANAGVLTVINTQIFNNHANKHGGGICNMDMYAQLEVSNCKITDNTASKSGGGIANFNALSIQIENTLIAGNSCSAGAGGAIHAGSKFGGNVYLKNVTIADNSASWGGDAIFNQTANFYFSHTLIYNCNTMFESWGDNGKFISEGYNFIDNITDSDWTSVTGDIIGTNSNVFDPWLNADYTLSDSSIVVNAGNPDGTFADVDLAGATRVYGGTVDIGAYEFQGDKLLKDMVMNVDTFPVWFDNQQIGEQSYVLSRILSLESGNDILRISSITAPAGFTMATTEDGTFENTLTDIKVGFDEEFTLYIRMEPVAEQVYEGVITINNNTDNPVIEIPVSGIGANLSSPFVFVNTPPVIDGTVDNLWDTISHYRLANSYNNISHDIEAKFKGVWDTDSLYLLVQVLDDSLRYGEADIADDDNLELFLDFNNSKGESYDSDDYMIRFSYNTATPTFVSGGVIIDYNFSQAVPEANTLVYELAIPWDNATTVTPGAGNEIGIDFNIKDNDGTGLEDSISWNSTSGDRIENPSFFGIVVLLDGNGNDTQLPAMSIAYGNTEFTVACEDSVVIPITITNNGTGRDLIVSEGSDNTLEDVLDRFNENYSSLVDLIPSSYPIIMDGGSNNIKDGGGDMYDTGNYLSTNNETNIDYSDNVIINSSAFGANGKYFTRKVDGLFVMAADAYDISSFEITGNLGADGDGFVDGTVLELNARGVKYKGFLKRVYGAGDPSINHLIITKNVGNITHDFTTSTYNDDHTVNGLNEVNRIYYLLYAGTGGAYIDNEEAHAIMSEFCNSIELAGIDYAVSAQSSEEIDFIVYTSDLLNGTTVDEIIINSNDPVNTADTVKYTIHKQGLPTIELSQTQFNFGEVIENHYGKDTLRITNTGCDTLFVDSISTTNDYFFAHKEIFTILPGDTSEVYLYFLPEEIGEFNEFMTIHNNDEDKIINVKGVTADTIPPQVMTAYVNDDKPNILVINFDEEIVHQNGYEGFSISGSTGSISGVNLVANDYIEFNLSADVVFGELLTLTYNDSSTTVTDAATLLNALENFTDLDVANNVAFIDDVSPTIISAKVENANPDQVVLEFDEDVLVTNTDGIAIYGTTGEVLGIAGSGTSMLTITMDANILYGETLTLDYVQPVGNITDNAVTPNTLFSVSGLTIINKVEYIDVFAPEFVSAVVEDAAPTDIVLTFNEPVYITDATGCMIFGTPGTVTGVTGSGTNVITLTLDTDVVFGEGISFTYDDGNITDTAAALNNLVNFGPEPVVNNVLYAGGAQSNPIVIGASVEDANPNQVIVAFDEDVTLTDQTGFSILGITSNITGVTGSGNDTLIFTLDASVVYGDIVLLNYNATGDVQDVDLNALALFTNINVINNVAYADIEAPTLSSAKVENATSTIVSLTFDENVLFTDASGFTINGTTGSIVTATGSGTDVMSIELDAPVVYGESITIDYDQPTGNITDEATNDLASFTGFIVANYVEYVDETKPEVISAVVENSNPYEVIVTFTEEVTYTNYTGLTVNGTLGSIISISGDATDVITLTLDEKVVYGEVTTLDYSAGNITDLAVSPNSLDNFTGITIVNNVEAEIINPTILNAVIEHAAQADIIVTFDEKVYITDITGFTVSGISASLSSVGGSGTTVLTFTLDANVLYSDNIILSYGGLGNIEDRVGNILMPVDFGVTNNILNNDATLSDLKVDGITVTGFDAATLVYNVELPYGTTVVPTATATATDANSNIAIVDATALPGSTTVTVTAEDGTTEQVYTINFTVAPNDDATLADLEVDGTTVTGFDAATLTYDVILPYGTSTIPTVAATATDANANIAIVDATALPGSTTVTVTAEDGTTELVYTVSFTIAPNADATLSDLAIDGTTVTGFDAATLTYNVELAAGTTIAPTVTATATDANADVSIVDATSLPGSTTVTVTAEDGTTLLVYTINFTVATGINDLSQLNIKVYPNPSSGKFKVELDRNNSNMKVEIVSIVGKVVFANEYTHEESIEIDVTSVPQGIYFVNITDGHAIATKRIVIE